MLVALAFAPFALAGVLLYALRRKTLTLTPEAAKAKAQIETPHTVASTRPVKPSALEQKLNELVALKIVRYPAAAGLFWLAYELGVQGKPNWFFVAATVIIALLAAHELFLWLTIAGIIIGVLALGFNLVAALPVSVAVVIAALIIAGAIKK